MRASDLAKLPLILLAFGACGNIAPKAHAGTNEVTSAQAKAVPLTTVSDPSLSLDPEARTSVTTPPPSLLGTRIGSLDHPIALKHLFESLARLEAGIEHEDVRIVQFGDSHTAADMQTGAARRILQSRFGDGGRGFVAIGAPYAHYLQAGTHAGMSSEWVAQRGKMVRGHFTGDGEYGLAGMSIETTKSGAKAWTDVAPSASKVEIAYRLAPGGGSFDLYADGAKLGRIATHALANGSGFRSFDLSDQTPHHIEARTVGDGDVRLFGVALDRAQAGVTYDALGINGARFTTALQWDEAHMAEQLQHRNPALIVLAYGTNESGDETSPETFERQVVDLLGRMARAVPSASCMIVGPPDRAIETPDGWVTSEKILDRIASEQRVANAAGCAFFDQFSAMGGVGTIASWATDSPRRAQKDRVHLTQGGYEVLGYSLASDLVNAYTVWRAENGLAPRVP